MLRSLLPMLLIIIPSSFYGQLQGGIKGVVLETGTQSPIPNVVVALEGSTYRTTTENNGEFLLVNVRSGNYILRLQASNYIEMSFSITIEDNELDLGDINMGRALLQDVVDNLITLTDSELTDDDGISDTSSGLLQASRDVILNTAAFDFGQAFFRLRGYDNREGLLLINGVAMNKLYNGRPQWNNWGGLNDVLRHQEFTNGIEASPYGFGGVLGTTNIDTRASSFRPGYRISLSSSDKTYAGRIMATYSSGLRANKWAVTLSASRRWAQEGYIQGTQYESFSLFGSLEYRIGENHALNFTSIYSPNSRGSSTSITEEVFELTGRRYNPNVGYQEGRIRNEYVRRIEEPIIMINHYYDSDKLMINSAFTYQAGQFGRGRINFQNANNPSPVYYRKLPSYYLNLEDRPDYENAELARKSFLENPYINYAQLYDANLRKDGDGRSVYVLYEDRTDDTQWSLNTVANYFWGENLKLDAGIVYRNLKSENFGYLTDLLGGTFYNDIDPFTNTENNVNGDPIKGKGDKFLYNYIIKAQTLDAFMQARYETGKINLFLSAGFNETTYNREGLFTNGQFEDNSFGEGPKQSFTNFSAKAGLAYKIAGRHFLSLNAGMISKSPTIQNAFANARVNHDIIPGLAEERINTIDLNYLVRSNDLKLRATAFYTRFRNTTEVSFFYLDNIPPILLDEDNTLNVEQDFISETVTDLEKLHLGLELGADLQLSPAFSLSAVAVIGKFTLNNDPQIYIGSDEIPTVSLGRAYLKNYRVAAGPQEAYSLSLEYRDPSYWWIRASFNYLARNYIDVSAVSRTDNFFVNPEDPDGFPFPEADPAIARQLLKQQQINEFSLINLVGGKSWRYRQFFISTFLSLNNLFDQTYQTGGFEQTRSATYRALLQDNANGTPSFGPRYFYGFGRTYFLNVALSF